MDSVSVDNATASLLRWFKQPVKIVDEEGNWMGTFEPVAEKSLYRDMKSPLSEDEPHRRDRKVGGRSLPQILDDLENRPRD